MDDPVVRYLGGIVDLDPDSRLFLLGEVASLDLEFTLVVEESLAYLLVIQEVIIELLQRRSRRGFFLEGDLEQVNDLST